MTNNRKLAIFSGGQKGGSGKTTFARAYLDVARRAGRRVAAFDADGPVGQLVQYYGTRTNSKLDGQQDPFQGVGFFDVRADSERDTILNIAELDADTILVDLPGGAIPELAKVLGDGRQLFESYQRAGYEPIVVLTISPMKASVRTVQEAIRLFGDSVRYVVVKNLFYAPADRFMMFDGFELEGKSKGGIGRRLLDEANGELLTLEAMHLPTYLLLDAEDLQFSKASANGLPRADRERVKGWLDRFEASLAGTAIAP